MRAREVVVCPVGKEIEGSRARREEGTPPPPVVLGAEVQVAHDHGALSARDDEDGEDKEEEAEHVVEAVLPDGRENEEHLDKHDAERQKASHDDGARRVQVPLLGGDLAGDRVRLHRRLYDLALEPEVRSEEDERERDAKPEEHQHNERAEGHGCGALLAPRHDVHQEKHGEAHAREDDGRQERGLKVVGLLHELAEARPHVPRGNAHEHVEEEHRREQRTAVRRREEAKRSERQSQVSHDEKLHACAGVDGEEGGVGGGAEDVSVHELPACLLAHVAVHLGAVLLSQHHLVVAGEVLAEDTGHDEADDSREEDEDDERVGDREPVDLVILDLVHLQVHVPAGGPLDVAKLPLHVVGPDDLLALSRVDDEGIVLQKLPAGGLLARGKARVGDRALVPLPPVRVLDRVRVHVEANNVVAISVPAVLAVHGVVQNLEAKVVVKDILVILLVRLLLGALLELAAEAVT
mmetsp:Transcript_33193/g.81496  ORF Transcript_33193/g.81496 Transcript_33193/m.81496 type:complete len:465 (-) Transcript_33193:489-1883(-)